MFGRPVIGTAMSLCFVILESSDVFILYFFTFYHWFETAENYF